jgi:hypothetical protein
MFPSFPCYKEGTGGRGQIEPGLPVINMLIMYPEHSYVNANIALYKYCEFDTERFLETIT